jgi:hypothetical protein
MRDLHHLIGAVLALSPAVQAATIKGPAIDLRGFAEAELIITTGAIVGAGDFTAKLQESNTTTDGDFTDVAAADLLGTLPVSLTAEGAFKQGYIGSKRFVRVVLTKNGGTSIAVAGVLVKGAPALAPVA